MPRISENFATANSCQGLPRKMRPKSLDTSIRDEQGAGSSKVSGNQSSGYLESMISLKVKKKIHLRHTS